MKKIFLMLFFLVLLQISYGTDKIKSSIVKIYSTHQQYDYRSPWQNGSDYNSTSTGFIVDGNRILTNAHAVLSNRFLQVRKEGESKKYKASVEFISEEYDRSVVVPANSETIASSCPVIAFIREDFPIFLFPKIAM